MPQSKIEKENSSAIEFFDAVYASFQRAAQKSCGPIDHHFKIGQFSIRLRFAGPALMPVMLPALAHLVAQPIQAPADFTICLWDSASTGIRLPSPPWSWANYADRGEVRDYNDDRFRTAYFLEPGTLHMLDAKRNLAIYSTHDARHVPQNEMGSPLLHILHWWMRTHEWQLIHAAAIGKTSGGVLLAGKGGSGKSTTALACLGSDLLYVGDDYCLLSLDTIPYAHSLYSSGKLDWEMYRQFSHLAPTIYSANQRDAEKALFFLHPLYSEKISLGFPIRAILLPRVTHCAQTTLAAASPMTALRALAPSTLFQLSGAGRREFHSIAKLVKQVPCYYLDLGVDVVHIPDKIAECLSAS